MPFKCAAILLLCYLSLSACSVYKSADRKDFETDYSSENLQNSFVYLSCTAEEQPICTQVRQ
jgi:hypothetical protein